MSTEYTPAVALADIEEKLATAWPNLETDAIDRILESVAFGHATGTIDVREIRADLISPHNFGRVGLVDEKQKGVKTKTRGEMHRTDNTIGFVTTGPV